MDPNNVTTTQVTLPKSDVQVTLPAATTLCNKCHSLVRKSDYFCYNCGNNLKPTPVSTSIAKQIMYYIGCILLFPIGLWWSLKYFRDERGSAKMIGLAMVLITAVFGVLITLWINNFVSEVNTQINQQMQMLNF